MKNKKLLKKLALSSLCVAVVAPSVTLSNLVPVNVYAEELSVYNEAIQRIASYSFEDNASDSSGENHHGVLAGNISFVNGLSGKAASFNGGKITLPKNELQFGADQDFSVSFWLKASPTDDDVIISNKNWDSGANQGWLIGIENNFLLWNWKGSNSNRLDLKQQKKIVVADNKWHHIVVTHDRDQTAKFYKDGQLEHEMNIAGKGDINTGLELNIGADGNNHYQLKNGIIDEMGITNTVLNQESVQTLYNEYKDAANPPLTEKFNGKVDFVGAEHTVNGAEFTLNLHLRTNNMENGVDKIHSFVNFDASKFEFVSGPEGVTEKQPGVLEIDVDGGKNFNDKLAYDYANTKIAELRFKSKVETGTGEFEITDSEFYTSNEKYEIESLEQSSATVTIHGKDQLDKNEDGSITISDLFGSDLSDELKQQIAENIDTKPYKHVVVIGIDGGGEGIHKKAPYFETKNSFRQEVGDVLNIPHIRSLVEGGAVSYTAQAVLPSSSSPNWGAMISGVGYDKHQIYNTESGKWYYHLNEYPTVFKKIREQMPDSKMAAFSNWKNITQGHIEPSVGVETYNGNDATVAQQVSQYVTSEKMRDTSLIFIQLDELDGVGHTYGFYSKAYYEKLNNDIDKHVNTIVGAIDEAGIREETLILLTSDHGGGTETEEGGNTSEGSHGQDSELAKTIYLGANGRTVATEENGEKILTGGSNVDVATTILYGLDLNDPTIGDGTVLDGMFVEQSDINNENAPTLTLQRDKKTYHVLFDGMDKLYSTGQKAVEIDININNVEIKKIKSQKGVKIHSAQENGDTIKIVAMIDSTVSLKKPLIELKTANNKNAPNKLTISEAYVTSSDGKDIMLNLKAEEKR
ncbi:LamG-like jellyroll fold domain-containing protein [Metabacillus sp. FJAT-53654]|uniref:LamG-like jellyroll fold domain-containing protein n=1 Tax=Metabacillus rhizosphaerae TaxID=3117747 RepID=A0ABZ2MW29_9BACI